MVEVSTCCKAPVQVEGKTTMYWVCSKCGNSCDAVEDKKEEEDEDAVLL